MKERSTHRNNIPDQSGNAARWFTTFYSDESKVAFNIAMCAITV